jgi:hypothetical protein
MKTMKKLQQLFALVVLTLMLSASTLAGDGTIWTMKTDPPPPPPSSVMTTNEAAEDEGIITTWRTANDSVTEVVQSLLPGVLALF